MVGTCAIDRCPSLLILLTPSAQPSSAKHVLTASPAPGGGKGGEGKIEKSQHAALHTNTWPGGQTVISSPPS